MYTPCILWFAGLFYSNKAMEKTFVIIMAVSFMVWLVWSDIKFQRECAAMYEQIKK